MPPAYPSVQAVRKSSPHPDQFGAYRLASCSDPFLRHFPTEMSRAKRIALLPIVLLAACTTTSDTWGGYTENEAKEILALPNVRQTIVDTTPRTIEEAPVARIYPTEAKLEETDLRKVTVQGEEAWEYNDEQNQFCLYVWEDPETQTYFAQSSRCVAD
jgi:hypothetical protein